MKAFGGWSVAFTRFDCRFTGRDLRGRRRKLRGIPEGKDRFGFLDNSAYCLVASAGWMGLRLACLEPREVYLGAQFQQLPRHKSRLQQAGSALPPEFLPGDGTS